MLFPPNNRFFRSVALSRRAACFTNKTLRYVHLLYLCTCNPNCAVFTFNAKLFSSTFNVCVFSFYVYVSFLSFRFSFFRFVPNCWNILLRNSSINLLFCYCFHSYVSRKIETITKFLMFFLCLAWSHQIDSIKIEWDPFSRRSLEFTWNNANENKNLHIKHCHCCRRRRCCCFSDDIH